MSTREPDSRSPASPPDPRPDGGASPADRRLWSRLASPPGGPCPDPLDLAAYLDERLAPDALTALESHIAACADCRLAVRELRAVLALRDETPFALSPAAIASAKALVPAPADAHVFAATRANAPIAVPVIVNVPRLRLRWPAVARFGTAAAASIVVCLIGFRTGTASFVSEERADADLVHEMSFGLVDDGADDGADAELALFALSLDASGEEATP